MGLPATTPPLPLSVLDFGWLLERLPAEARAQVAWAKKPIDEGLARLRTEDLTDPLIHEVAREIRKPLTAAVAVASAWFADLAGQHDVLEVDLERDHERLRSLLADDESQDTLGWIMEFLHSLLDVSINPLLVRGEAIERPPGREEHDRLAALLDDARGFLRGGVVLMATIEIAKLPSVTAKDVERARDLVDIAFLELMELSDHLSAVLEIPFVPPPTAPAAQGARVLFYAQRVRDALSDADWDVIERGRMGNLR